MIKSESIIPLLTVCANSENAGCARVGKLSIEIINRQKAEIERLKKNIDGLNIFTTNLMKVIRLQAIKEFAERLKEIIYTHENRVDVDGIVFLTRIDNSIDNLVKEMTEVQE